MTVKEIVAGPHLFCPDVHDSVVSARKRDEVAARVTDCLMRGSQERSLAAKRSVYNEAFSAIKASFYPELRPLLFRLFEKYAMETCYAQESEERDATGKSLDDELGFRMCARLMELSFCMQMEDLGFRKCEYDWSSQPSLEALTGDLHIGPQQKGLLFDVIDQTLFDVDVLVATAQKKGLQAAMADTLRSLSFSYQNITSLSDSTHLTLHGKLQDWTAALIGKETIEQKQRLAEYLYNRCAFMLEIQHASWDAQVKSYEPIKAAFEECYPTGHPQLVKKQAQINNVQGCIIARSGQKDALALAEPYFRKAYELYSSIPRDKFLIGNVLSGLIACLVSKPLDQEAAGRLQEYAAELGSIFDEFQKEGNHHLYVAEYPKSIQKAEAALKEYRSHSSLGTGI